MIYIKKNINNSTIEELQRAKNKSNIASKRNARDVFDAINKSIVVENLREEQHGLCAYCMRKLTTNICVEHYNTIDKNCEKALDYNNMFAVCKGGENEPLFKKKHYLHCDKSRGNQNITINPLREEHIATISYLESTGEIQSTNKAFLKDFEILHLNGIIDENHTIIEDPANFLKNRKDAFRQARQLIEKVRNQNHQINQNKLKKLIKDEENRKEYREFEGVILYFLKRRLK